MSKVATRDLTVYVSGPMSGYPDFNFPAFDDRRDMFKAMGFKVISPADLERMFPASRTEGEDRHHQLCLKRDFKWLVDKCDAATYLPGHELSKGAMGEKVVAEIMGLPEINQNGHIVARRKIKRIVIEYED